MKKFYLKIILPTILSIVLFILTIFFVIIPQFQENIMAGKREMIKELTNTACSILSKYENDEKVGLMSGEEARELAVSRILHMRYGDENKDYFWITDLKPVMIVHPFRPDLNGEDLTHFTDPHGKYLFVECVETVKKAESGYVDYMWQWKDDSLHIVPKLSFVRLFKPWNWVVGTGVYIDDVQKEIGALTRRLLWITAAISFLIALIILYVINQSLHIERSRSEAENSLHETKEKYRALVEAATEGLLMLTDGKISFANSVISSMSGYDYAELIHKPINTLVSKHNNKDIIEIFLKDSVKDGQFELNLLKKDGSNIEVLLTSSTTVFYGKLVNIFIVRDLSVNKNAGVSDLDYQKLISTLTMGFFKAGMGSKGGFLMANETAIRILGYTSLSEMTELHFVKFLVSADDRKALLRNLSEHGFVKSEIIKIRRKSGEMAVVTLSLVIVSNEGKDEFICDGIIEDITLTEKEKTDTIHLISSLKSREMLLESSVSEFSQAYSVLDLDASLQEAVGLFQKRKPDCLLITKNDHEFVGIVTSSDIQNRILALNLKPDNPVYLIMSSPIEGIDDRSIVSEAVRLCNEKNISHLVIKNAFNEISGIFHLKAFYQRLTHSLSYHIVNIGKAETIGELKQLNQTLGLLLRPLIKSEIAVTYLTSISSSFSDAILRRTIELSLNETGSAPVCFAFICLGSEGRKEETLLTDQDNALVFKDVPKEQESVVNAYFKKLSEKVCTSLNEIGYTFCKGNIMAMNPQWCQPLKVWEKCFADWISTPEPQQILDAAIFFDFRIVYGDESLTNRLQIVIEENIAAHPSFLYHLAHNAFNTKVQHVSGSNLLGEKHSDWLDLKAAVAPIIQFARVYALENHIWHTNTMDRLMALKESHKLRQDTIDEVVFVYSYLMRLRFKNQIALADGNQAISNLLTIKNLIEIEQLMLK